MPSKTPGIQQVSNTCVLTNQIPCSCSIKPRWFGGLPFPSQSTWACPLLPVDPGVPNSPPRSSSQLLHQSLRATRPPFRRPQRIQVTSHPLFSLKSPWPEHWFEAVCIQHVRTRMHTCSCSCLCLPLTLKYPYHFWPLSIATEIKFLPHLAQSFSNRSCIRFAFMNSKYSYTTSVTMESSLRKVLSVKRLPRPTTAGATETIPNPAGSRWELRPRLRPRFGAPAPACPLLFAKRGEFQLPEGSMSAQVKVRKLLLRPPS